MKTALTLLAALGCMSLTAGSQTADTIYHGGPVITINDDAPHAEAVAVKDGKIYKNLAQ